MAGSLHDPQLRRGRRSFRELPGIREWHHLVVGSVQHEERTRRQRAGGGDGVDRRDLAAPLGHRLGEVGRTHHSDAPRVFEQSSGLTRPITQTRGRSQGGDTTYEIVVGGHRDRECTAFGHADEPHTPHVIASVEMRDCGADVIEPTADREVTLARTRAAAVERQCDASRLAGDALGELGERGRRGDRAPRAGREAVTQHDTWGRGGA